MPEKVIIYTDGGCDPNPGLGGWAALIIRNNERKEISGGEPYSTNNRMELTAVIQALHTLPEPSIVTLYTDSQYVKKGIEEWLPKWITKNWRGSNGKVANQDLWKELLSVSERHKIAWRWVKGHSGDFNNSRVDWLVSEARKQIA